MLIWHVGKEHRALEAAIQRASGNSASQTNFFLCLYGRRFHYIYHAGQIRLPAFLMSLRISRLRYIASEATKPGPPQFPSQTVPSAASWKANRRNPRGASPSGNPASFASVIIRRSSKTGIVNRFADSCNAALPAVAKIAFEGSRTPAQNHRICPALFRPIAHLGNARSRPRRILAQGNSASTKRFASDVANLRSPN